MGYATAHSLEVEKLDDSKETKETSIDELILQVTDGKIDKKVLLKKLHQVKEGVVLIDDEYIIAQLREFSDEAKYSIDESGDTRNSSSWYESEKDLKEFSKKFPNWLFTLSGEGEESGDIWKCYFVDGKSQMEKAKFTIDPFNVNKLKK